MSTESKMHARPDYRFYATVAADLNMYTQRPARAAGKDTLDRPAVGFIALGPGDVQLRPEWTKGVAGNDQTFTVATGIWYPLQFSHIIDAGTTVTNLLVVW